MAKKNLKRLWPIVYDALTSYPFVGQDLDALTYYEMLRMIICRLNETIGVVNDLSDDIEETVKDILNEWLADGTLEEIISETVLGYMKVFYVPEEFGAKGDGLTDDSDAFDQACEAMASGDIKILFIPAKTYVIGSTIAIPEGCTVIGTGPESVIYYSELVTNYAVGLTNAGNNVTIKNIRVEQEREIGTITWGSQTGCISFGTLDEHMAGKIDTPSGTWSRKNTHGLRAENIYSETAPYVLQVETPNSGDYSISDVTVRGVYAPQSLLSFMSKAGNGYIKDILYDDVIAYYIRADQGGNNVINGKVSNFMCRGMMLSCPGLTAEHGTIDATDDVRYTYEYALLLKAGTKLKDTVITGGASSLVYAIACAGFSQGATVLEDVTASGFNKIIRAAENNMTNPFYMYNCDLDWNLAAIDYHAHFQGIATNCRFRSDFHPTRPFYENQTKLFPSGDTTVTFNSDSVTGLRITEGFHSLNDKMHISLMRDIPVEDGGVYKLLTIADAFKGYIGASGSEVPVMLWSNNGQKSALTTAVFNASQELNLVTTGLTMTDYDYYTIEADLPINPLVWS